MSAVAVPTAEDAPGASSAQQPPQRMRTTHDRVCWARGRCSCSGGVRADSVQGRRLSRQTCERWAGQMGFQVLSAEFCQFPLRAELPQ